MCVSERVTPELILHSNCQFYASDQEWVTYIGYRVKRGNKLLQVLLFRIKITDIYVHDRACVCARTFFFRIWNKVCWICLVFFGP